MNLLPRLTKFIIFFVILLKEHIFVSRTLTVHRMLFIPSVRKMCQHGSCWSVAHVMDCGLDWTEPALRQCLMFFFGTVRLPRGPVKTRARFNRSPTKCSQPACASVYPTADSNNLLLSRWGSARVEWVGGSGSSFDVAAGGVSLAGDARCWTLQCRTPRCGLAPKKQVQLWEKQVTPKPRYTRVLLSDACSQQNTPFLTTPANAITIVTTSKCTSMMDAIIIIPSSNFWTMRLEYWNQIHLRGLK